MKIDPAYTSVGGLFEHKPMFFIPKYQRAYAWEEESVKDFINDLENVFLARKNGVPINHFFGGILSVKHTVVGTVNQHEYELIDGQQRIATFSLLATCIIYKYKGLLEKIDSDIPLYKIVQKRVETLSERFVEFEQEIQRIVNNMDVLILSKADKQFYRELVHDMNPDIERNSHQNLSTAYAYITEKVDELVDKSTNEHLVDDLEILMLLIDDDFTLLHMVTEDKSDAFRLFQVLNDRGTSLTDGDLLRAKSLELVEGFREEQDSIEKTWDKILSDPPAKTANYLNWIYESFQGKRPKANTLFDKYLDDFFPEYKQVGIEAEDAEKIHSRVKSIYHNILNCRQLKEGQWLYENKQPITSWDRNRLNLLLVELNHELSLPLFLAASNLNHKKFSMIVQMIERSFFRYKIICNQHVTPLKKIYYDEALSIREDPGNYDVEILREKLSSLIDEKASDDRFISYLTEMEYKVKHESNKPLKYFLLTIDYYYSWYKKGAIDSPECLDKSKLYDFSGTSIEHIYPRNAPENEVVIDLEGIKNTLGNLTIMDPAQNTIGDNDSFNEKKPLYELSTSDLTKEIGKKDSWGAEEIGEHKNNLIDAALKIFRP